MTLNRPLSTVVVGVRDVRHEYMSRVADEIRTADRLSTGAAGADDEKGKPTAGGTRGGFSDKSRRKIKKIIRSSLTDENCYMLTLTYSKIRPKDGKELKGHCDALSKRLLRADPHLYFLRTTEFQENGVPHVHIYSNKRIDAGRAKKDWREIVGDKTITQVRSEKFRSGVEAAAYYASKPAQKEPAGFDMAGTRCYSESAKKNKLRESGEATTVKVRLTVDQYLCLLAYNAASARNGKDRDSFRAARRFVFKGEVYYGTADRVRKYLYKHGFISDDVMSDKTVTIIGTVVDSYICAAEMLAALEMKVFSENVGGNFYLYKKVRQLSFSTAIVASPSVISAIL